MLLLLFHCSCFIVAYSILYSLDSDIDKAMEALPTGKPQAAPKKKKRDKSPKPNGGSNKNKPVVQANPNPPKIAILKRGDEAPPAAAAESATAAAVSASSADLEEVLKKSLAEHFKRQESIISDQVQKAVKSEIQTTVVPTLSKMMTQTMEQAVVKPVKAAIDKNAKERTKVQTDVIVSAVSESVQEPLKNAFEQVRFNGFKKWFWSDCCLHVNVNAGHNVPHVFFVLLRP